MRITGIKSVDYYELQRLRNLVEEHSVLSRTSTTQKRKDALVYLIQDTRLYESGRAQLAQVYPEVLVDFLPICMAHKGKVIYVPFV